MFGCIVHCTCSSDLHQVAIAPDDIKDVITHGNEPPRYYVITIQRFGLDET
jgi:hypothetical protein